MYFYASINFGFAAAISTSFIARDHGHWLTFLVTTIVLAAAAIVLPVGKGHYIKTPPRGSIILEVRYPFIFWLFLPSCLPPFLLQCVRVFTITASTGVSTNPITTCKNVKKPGFYGPAKPTTHEKSSVPAKITRDDQLVEAARTFVTYKLLLVPLLVVLLPDRR